MASSNVKGIIKTLTKPSTSQSISPSTRANGIHETCVSGTIIKTSPFILKECLDFIGTPLSGYAPLTVNFVTSGIWEEQNEYYEFYFNCGIYDPDHPFSYVVTDEIINNTVTLDTPGIYSVAIEQFDDILDETLTRAHYITVSEFVNPIGDPSFEEITQTGSLPNGPWGYWTTNNSSFGTCAVYHDVNSQMPHPDGLTDCVRIDGVSMYGSGYATNRISQSFTWTGIKTLSFWVYYSQGGYMFGPNNANIPLYVQIDGSTIYTVNPSNFNTWYKHTITGLNYTGTHQLSFYSELPMGVIFAYRQAVSIDNITVTG